MIDNPLQANLLVTKLKAALPLPATATPPLLAQLHEQAPGRDLSPQCQITGIHYARDEGGIVQTRLLDTRRREGVLRIDYAPDL